MIHPARSVSCRRRPAPGRTERGFILIAALLSLLAITGMAFAMWLVSSMDVRVATNIRQLQTTSNFAQAGLGEALAEMTSKEDPLNDNDDRNPDSIASMVQAGLLYNAWRTDFQGPPGATPPQYQYRILLDTVGPPFEDAPANAYTINYRIQVEPLRQVNGLDQPVDQVEILKSVLVIPTQKQ